MNWAIFISALSLAVSAMAFTNAFIARKQLKKDSLYTLRKTTFLKAKEVEIEWQSILNELFHFRKRAITEISNEQKKIIILSYIDDLNSEFYNSYDHVLKMRKSLEHNFEKISEEDAKKSLLTFESIHLSLKSSREEMLKKLNLLI